MAKKTAIKKATEKREGRANPSRTVGKVNYNIEALAKKAFEVPKPVKVIKKKQPKTKGTKKAKGPYRTLVVRAINALVEANKKAGKQYKRGVGLQAIANYLAKHNDATDTRRIKTALEAGVLTKTVVKSRLRYRLSSKAAAKQAKKGTKRKTTDSGKKGSKTATKKRKTGSEKPKSRRSANKTTKTKKAAKPKASKKSGDAKKVKKLLSKAAEIAESVIGSISEGAGNAVWQYYDKGWHNYDSGASDIVEGVYQEYKLNPGIDVRAVKSGYFNYTVDFTNLKQANIETGTTRNIRRHINK